MQRIRRSELARQANAEAVAPKIAPKTATPRGKAVPAPAKPKKARKAGR